MKRVLVVTCVLLILTLIVTVSIFYRELNYSIEKDIIPRENRTFERKEGIFFNKEITIYPSNVEIVEYLPNQSKLQIGVTIETWNINFGVLPEGVDGRRYLNLDNIEEGRYKILIKSAGNISSMINIDEDEFYLSPGEYRQVPVFLNTTGSKSGNYTGEIAVITIIPKYSFLERLS